jgi:hypothetical protein
MSSWSASFIAASDQHHFAPCKVNERTRPNQGDRGGLYLRPMTTSLAALRLGTPRPSFIPTCHAAPHTTTKLTSHFALPALNGQRAKSIERARSIDAASKQSMAVGRPAHGRTPRPFRNEERVHSRALVKEEILFLCVPWRTPHSTVRVYSVVGLGTVQVCNKNKIDAHQGRGKESTRWHGSGSASVDVGRVANGQRRSFILAKRLNDITDLRSGRVRIKGAATKGT